MIDSVSFENFKGLQNVTVPLGKRFCVLVGQNGAGKTSILQGIHFHSQCSFLRPSAVFTGARDARRLAFSGGDGSFLLAAMAEGRTLAVRSESRGGDMSPLFRAAIDDGEFSATEDHIGMVRDRSLFDVFGRCVLLKLDATELARPSVGGVTRLEFDGTGLPSVLASLKLRDDDRFGQIKIFLQEIVPSVLSFHIEQREVYDANARMEKPGFSLLFKTQQASDVPADLMSEGTLLVLGLLTVILGPTSPKIILLDDIDRALHPQAQRQLVKLIRSLLKSMPDLQVIATSHSPYLIDEMELDEVVIVGASDLVGPACRRLSEHPDADKWKNLAETGEFWTSVGDSWVAEQLGVEK